MTSPASNVLARLAIVMLSVGLSTSLGEMALRMCQCARLGLAIPGTAGVLPFPDNPTGRFRFSYNSLGDRTREPVAGHTEDESWCVAGDSHTNGLGVDDADRLSEILERSLNRHGRNVLVFNVATPGATLPHYVAMIGRCQTVYHARTIIVVVYLGNDLVELAHWVDYGRPPVAQKATVGWGERMLRPLRRSLVFDSLTFALRSVRDRRRPRSTGEEDGLQAYTQADFYAANPARETSDLDVFDVELQAIVRAAAAGNVRLIVATLPSWLQSDGRTDRSKRARAETALEARIAQRIAGAGVEHVDLTPALAADSGPEFWAVDRHLSTRGHAVAGAVISEHVGLRGRQ